MPIHTHYQNITCLTILSWLMTLYMIDYIEYTYFKIHIKLHMVKYICIHPLKFFIQLWVISTQLGKSKTRGNVYQEIGTQNINEGKIQKGEVIHITRIIGNTNIGGGT